MKENQDKEGQVVPVEKQGADKQATDKPVADKPKTAVKAKASAKSKVAVKSKAKKSPAKKVVAKSVDSSVEKKADDKKSAGKSSSDKKADAVEAKVVDSAAEVKEEKVESVEPKKVEPKKKPKTKKRSKPSGGGSSFWIYIYALIAAAMVGYYFYTKDDIASVKSDWSQVEELIAKREVKSITVINRSEARVELTEQAIEKYRADQSEDNKYVNIPVHGTQLYFKIGSVESFREDLAAAERRYHYSSGSASSSSNVSSATGSASRRKSIPVIYDDESEGWLFMLLRYGFPWILIIGFWLFLSRGMLRGAGGSDVMSVGKAKAQEFDKDNNRRVTFKDVAGLEEAKVEIMEIVDFLKNADKYVELGAKIPKGALLVGPPGTGKTLLAKAVAGEADVPFLSMSGSDFVEMFVGVGASRVRDLFAQAKKKAPCILFIDEIDAIGRARSSNGGYSSNDERENTLNQMLTEMDGFQTNAGVIVLAATNRADILDKALLRAGRFDRQIEVGLPDVVEREQIFNVHLSKLKLVDGLDRTFLAKQTPGFSGADIANVCNEAALIAARHAKSYVEKQDFLSAIDRIIGGLERKNKIMTDFEKRRIAYHEAGHATVSWLLESASPLIKVTIIPRGKALGAAWYLPEERQITTKEHMLEDMASTMGGRVAEQLTFGEISTGALNDLERVTKQAYSMIAYYGMGKKVGSLSYYDSTGQGAGFTKPYSEHTAQQIDLEARGLIDDSYKLAEKVLKKHSKELKQIAELLLKREVIFTEDVERILGRRKKDIAADKLAAKKSAATKGAAKKVAAKRSAAKSGTAKDKPKAVKA